MQRHTEDGGPYRDRDTGQERNEGDRPTPSYPPGQYIRPAQADVRSQDARNRTAVPPPPPFTGLSMPHNLLEQLRHGGFLLPETRHPAQGHEATFSQTFPPSSNFFPASNYYGGNLSHYPPFAEHYVPPTEHPTRPGANVGGPTNGNSSTAQPPHQNALPTILGVIHPDLTATVMPQIPLHIIMQLQQQLAAASGAYNGNSAGGSTNGASIVMYPVPAPPVASPRPPVPAPAAAAPVPRQEEKEDSIAIDNLPIPSMIGVPRVKKRKRKYTHESFPEKLHRLILEAKQDEKEHIVCFSEDGSKFQILSTAGFEAEILPKYFRHNKITSFKRLLHMYGFRRIQGT